jgi:hypothetical protein
MFHYALATAQPVNVGEGERSSFQVIARVEGEPEKVLLQATRPTPWREQRIDLAAYRGKAVTLSMRVHGERYPIAAYVDDVAIWQYRLILPQVPKN